MNLNAYGFGPPDERKWIIVDIGVTFGREDTPGVDVILPDPGFLEERRDDILGIVLTHAHEDHIGAIGWLWPRLKAPVYATPFTAALVRDKLKERGLLDRVALTTVPLKGRFQIGPFDVELITLTHSIPEPNGLAIRTPLGLIWHTGDWKIDPDPLIGETTDEAALRRIADEGVLAMICDSTNVFVEGESGSEADVRNHLTTLIAGMKGKVAVACFASNVARLESAMAAAHACGRSVALVGRSMHRITAAARSVGLLHGLPDPIDESEAGYLPPEHVLYLCTGSQGEPRAALSRIASGEHRHVTLGKGDTVIFSSRVIPGNEHAIAAVQDTLQRRGVNVMTDSDAPVHVSGHPARDELRQMYYWARPQIAVPVHGERRHILEHQALALSLQTPTALAPRNGDLIRLAPGPAETIDEVPAGRLYVDGAAIIDEDNSAIVERKRLGAEGALTIAMAVNARSHAIVSGPDVRMRGLPAADEESLELGLDDVAEAAEAAYLRLNHADRGDDDAAEAAIVRAARKAADRAWGKRPFVDVIIMRV
ncbi:MAG: MBL fold metallo-hydrolase [Alphaproteobacteria bacterium]|nr:MBL fold metallo-hydrolase [Alphaproteobacteria bacterium]